MDGTNNHPVAEWPDVLEWPDDDVPAWMVTFPPLSEVDHNGVGSPGALSSHRLSRVEVSPCLPR